MGMVRVLLQGTTLNRCLILIGFLVRDLFKFLHIF